MKLEFTSAGSAQGFPVVLLHAFPMSSAMWEPQFGALSRYRVIAPDLRGFGRTPLVAPWFMEHAVDDVLETLDALHIDKAAFVGLSMGGYVCLRLAQKAPRRVAALALCDTRAEADANEAKLKRAAAVDFVRAHGTEPFVGPFLKDALGTLLAERNPQAVDLLRRVAAGAAPASLMAALAALAARPDMTTALSAITAPTLIMVGDQDRITPPALSQTMAKTIPGAQLQVLPGAGHFSSAETPAAFNAALVSFLEKTAKA